jgi:hypothetical protein
MERRGERSRRKKTQWESRPGKKRATYMRDPLD